MVQNTVIFANAVAKYNEGKLLDREKIRRLAEADFSDAVKMLIDYGYGGGVTDEAHYDVDAFIAEETNRLIEFIGEVSPDRYLSACLTNRFLYSNAKAAVKNKYSPFDIGSVLYRIGDVDVTEKIDSGDYAGLPAHMADALAEIDELFADKPADPITVDLLLTRAMYADNAECAAKSRSKLMQRYVRAEIDLVNIGATLRCTLLALGAETLERQFICGGTLPLDELTALVGQDAATAAQMLADSAYGDVVRAAESGMAQFETAADDCLYDICSQQCDNMTSLSPMLSYVTARLTEFKTVKTILVCLRGGARDQIARRLRGIYA